MTQFFTSLRRHTLLILGAALLALPAVAQTPQVAKVSSTRSNSTFLLGFYPTAAKTQSLYLPTDLAGAMAGTIQRLYFMYGSTGNTTGTTLSNLTIKLGQTADAGFAGGTTFFPDSTLKTVLTDTAYTIDPGNTGDWFTITLDSSFTYDPTQTLILQITFTGSTHTNFGTFGDTNNGKKLYADNAGAVTGSSSSSTWQHFGFDLQPLGQAAEMTFSSTLQVFPNPAHESLFVQVSDALPEPAELQLLDALGRPARTFSVLGADLRAGKALPLNGVPAGNYLLRTRQADRSQMRRVVVE